MVDLRHGCPSHNRSKRFAALLVLALLPALSFPHRCLAGSPEPGDTLLWRHATLTGWRRNVRLGLMDRSHAYGGLFFDRGVWRRLTPDMDHEYDLDHLMDAPTLHDDYIFYSAPNAYRSWLGSIDKSHLITASRIHLTVPLTTGQDALIDALQQEDLSARRFFVETGYARRLGALHSLEIHQTVASYKPDLDFTLAYRYEAPAVGSIRVEVTFLDVFNDFIFDVIGVDPVLEDTTRSYTVGPRLFSVYAASPDTRRLRGEITLGIQPASRARIASQSHPDLRFNVARSAAYAGALLEYAFPWVTTGITYRYTRSTFARQAPPGSSQTSDYATRQTDGILTGYALLPVWKLHAEAWVSHEWYTDGQHGTDFDQASIAAPFEAWIHNTTLRLALKRVPPNAGLIGGVELLAHDRRYDPSSPLFSDYLRFAQWSPNERLAMHLGYQFRPGAAVYIGAAFDLDGDPFYSDRGLTRFDSAFGRITITW